MNSECFSAFSARQKSVFEAIKAKHKNILAYFTKNKDNSLLLEIADMIFLLSAQLAQLDTQEDESGQESDPEGQLCSHLRLQ